MLTNQNHTPSSNKHPKRNIHSKNIQTQNIASNENSMQITDNSLNSLILKRKIWRRRRASETILPLVRTGKCSEHLRKSSKCSRNLRRPWNMIGSLRNLYFNDDTLLKYRRCSYVSPTALLEHGKWKANDLPWQRMDSKMWMPSCSDNQGLRRLIKSLAQIWTQKNVTKVKISKQFQD